jgi:hypothetical protein
MNRTRLIIIASAAAVLLVVGNTQTSRAQTATTTAGRFQLLAGEHFITGKATGFDQKDVFRIDTATGATSFFAEGVDKDGKAYIEWQPIK